MNLTAIIIFFLIITFIIIAYNYIKNMLSYKEGYIADWNLINLNPYKLSKQIKKDKDTRFQAVIEQDLSGQPFKNPSLKTCDYKDMNNPLKVPTLQRKPARNVIAPTMNSPWFNYPEREWLGNYMFVGYLIDPNASNNDPDKILSIYGRQMHPDTNQFEYYVMLKDTHLNPTQYKLDNYSRELYTGDQVVIDLLNFRKYKVLMFKRYEDIVYSPFLI